MENYSHDVVEVENSITEAEVVAGGDNSNGKFVSQTRFSGRDSPKQTGQELDNKKLQDEDDQLITSTRAEVGEAREENERLKKVLMRIVKDYKALQMHLFDIVQKDDQVVNDPPKTTSDIPIDLEEPELVSLRLGSGHNIINKKEEKKSKLEDDDGNRKKEGLTLGLDCKYDESTCINNTIDTSTKISSPDNNNYSSEDAKEEEAGDQPWPPSKVAKNLRSSTGDDEVTAVPQPQVKRARVSVRARCDTPTMNDGCQWRKYGQKVSKGNPCPRAYYRCTVAPLCPVRKQVQRCAEDMSILITTYEGTHNHPLPVSATAMASTTSAAACMLTSGSVAPRLAGSSSMPSSSSNTTNYGSINYPMTDNYRPSTTHQFYLPNQLITNSSNSHPTITLDLTNKYSSRYTPTPTTFNFSSSLDSNLITPIPTNWSSSTKSGYPTTSYNGTPVPFTTNYPLNQTYWQRAANSALAPPVPPGPGGNLSTDTIARAITSDPSFQSALEAAITSYVGTHGRPQGPANGNIGYGSRTFLNRTGSLGSSYQEGSTLMRQKSASSSPDGMEK